MKQSEHKYVMRKNNIC